MEAGLAVCPDRQITPQQQQQQQQQQTQPGPTSIPSQNAPQPQIATTQNAATPPLAPAPTAPTPPAQATTGAAVGNDPIVQQPSSLPGVSPAPLTGPTASMPQTPKIATPPIQIKQEARPPPSLNLAQPLPGANGVYVPVAAPVQQLPPVNLTGNADSSLNALTKARFQQALENDHNSILRPDLSPFTSTEDVVRRLLPYHVWNIPHGDLLKALGCREDPVHAAIRDVKRRRIAKDQTEIKVKVKQETMDEEDLSVKTDAASAPYLNELGLPPVLPQVPGLSFPSIEYAESLFARRKALKDRMARLCTRTDTYHQKAPNMSMTLEHLERLGYDDERKELLESIEQLKTLKAELETKETEKGLAPGTFSSQLNLSFAITDEIEREKEREREAERLKRQAERAAATAAKKERERQAAAAAAAAAGITLPSTPSVPSTPLGFPTNSPMWPAFPTPDGASNSRLPITQPPLSSPVTPAAIVPTATAASPAPLPKPPRPPSPVKAAPAPPKPTSPSQRKEAPRPPVSMPRPPPAPVAAAAPSPKVGARSSPTPSTPKPTPAPISGSVAGTPATPGPPGPRGRGRPRKYPPGTTKKQASQMAAAAAAAAAATAAAAAAAGGASAAQGTGGTAVQAPSAPGTPMMRPAALTGVAPVRPAPPSTPATPVRPPARPTSEAGIVRPPVSAPLVRPSGLPAGVAGPPNVAPSNASIPKTPIPLLIPVSALPRLTALSIHPVPAAHMVPVLGPNGAPSGLSGAPRPADPNQGDPAVLLGITESPVPGLPKTGPGSKKQQILHVSVVLTKLNPGQLSGLATLMQTLQAEVEAEMRQGQGQGQATAQPNGQA